MPQIRVMAAHPEGVRPVGGPAGSLAGRLAILLRFGRSTGWEDGSAFFSTRRDCRLQSQNADAFSAIVFASSLEAEHNRASRREIPESMERCLVRTPLCPHEEARVHLRENNELEPSLLLTPRVSLISRPSRGVWPPASHVANRTHWRV